MPTKKKATTKKGGRKPPTPRGEPEPTPAAEVESSDETEIQKVERTLQETQQKLLVLQTQARIDNDIQKLQAERAAVAEGSLSAAELLGRIDAGGRPPMASPDGKSKKDKKDKKKRKKPDTSESDDDSETDTDDTEISSSEDGFEDSNSELDSSDDGERASKKVKKDKKDKKAKKGDKVDIKKTIAHWKGIARNLPADGKREMKTLLSVMKKQHKHKRLSQNATRDFAMQLQLVMASCAANGDKTKVNQYKALVLQKEGKSNLAGVFNHKLFALACKQTGALQDSPKNEGGAAEGQRKRRTPAGQKSKNKPRWNVIDNREENLKKGGPKGGFCYRCDKPGHFARDCKKPVDKEAGSG